MTLKIIVLLRKTDNTEDIMGYKTDNKTQYTDDYTPDKDMSRMISSAIAQKKKGQKTKKRNKNIAIGCTIGGGVILIGAIIYFGGWITSVGKFLPNTYIDGVDVSKMTLKEATAAVTKGPSADYLSITKKDGSAERIPLDYFDYSYDISPEIKSFYDEISYSGWLGSYFKTTEYETVGEAEYDSEKLEYILRNTVWGTSETADARLDYKDGEYYIKSEVYGDIPDINILVDYVLGEVDKGDLSLYLSESGCFTEPTVFSKDLEELKAEMNEKFNFVITYDFNYTTETLSGADIYDWITVSSDGSFTVDRSKAENYIAGLAAKYDTFMTTRQFQTTERGVITMSQGRYSTGQYGWWIDQEKSVDKLLGYIENGQSVTVEPMYVTLDTGYCYEGFPSGRSADGDIGDTYIEVDLSAQHLWYYQNGELAFETDQIVSGKATDPSRKTPEGFYSVYTKSTNYTMKAADGSYSTKCSYFMRISFEGIGFHDLSRGSYGGNTYINNGSHGCINMRYSEVQKLYDMVERGTPVILYY